VPVEIIGPFSLELDRSRRDVLGAALQNDFEIERRMHL
jgi:hypothetical protein